MDTFSTHPSTVSATSGATHEDATPERTPAAGRAIQAAEACHANQEPQERPRPGWPKVAWQWLQRNTFAPRWLTGRWRHPVVGYVLAVLVQLVGVLLTALLLAASARFVFASALVLLGVVLVALNWGAGPSLVGALVGAVLIDVVELPPRLAWMPEDLWDGVALVVLVGVSLTMSLVPSSVERAKRRAEEERTEAQVHAEALQRVQARMDEFVAIASHDLRSPLTAALGFNDLASMRYERLASALVPAQPGLAGQVEAVRTCLQDASQSVERVQRLVDLLFDTTQVRAGKLDLHRTWCDVAAVVQDNVLALRVANPQRTLLLEAPCAGPVPVVADADRIGQVVTNYLTNALKYSPADQPVVVRVGHDGAWARVAVEDRGPGLSASEQERIWERFYQAEGVHVQSSGVGAGLGLGLHICKAIIEGHGEAVGVKSAVGKGSTFWFTLPLAGETG
ncbi:MAG TPA: HAMP domain-containing sensor histidine kinase [Ktedonobacterales bacterium]|nr:HAMP domain-containing sensor histidine kinase [Ktedonobacterales bacterium]